MGRHSLPSLWLDFLLVLGSLVKTGRAKYVPLLQPGFFFDYNIASQPVPSPLQCETFHIKWGRQGAIGPNPVAPYSLVVYTSYVTILAMFLCSGLSFDWDVRLLPGHSTRSACGIRTEFLADASQFESRSVTFPTLLDVDAMVPAAHCRNTGSSTRFAPPFRRINTDAILFQQCTDLSLTPESGKPPFSLTVAPALHPPYNITSNSMDPIDWTVSVLGLPLLPVPRELRRPDVVERALACGWVWPKRLLNNARLISSVSVLDSYLSCTDPTRKLTYWQLVAGVSGAFGAGIFGALVTFLFLRYRHKI
ncbi:hypothetical protein B0H17DRAFT_1221133 [Mycena rosella]|uniref:Uncharacterized protein n=1 Tax=Mycena rosella TaxID=1033263 RepID=A0AAD7B6E7_MYCRO|nr:hypothetical protein B0H17DRAFT_1221133 [Mycena rosella]